MADLMEPVPAAVTADEVDAAEEAVVENHLEASDNGDGEGEKAKTPPANDEKEEDKPAAVVDETSAEEEKDEQENDDDDDDNDEEEPPVKKARRNSKVKVKYTPGKRASSRLQNQASGEMLPGKITSENLPKGS